MTATDRGQSKGVPLLAAPITASTNMASDPVTASEAAPINVDPKAETRGTETLVVPTMKWFGIERVILRRPWLDSEYGTHDVMRTALLGSMASAKSPSQTLVRKRRYVSLIPRALVKLPTISPCRS